MRFHLLNNVSAFLCLLCYDVHEVRDNICKSYDAYDWLRRPLSGWFFLYIRLMVSRRELIYYASPLSLSTTCVIHYFEPGAQFAASL